MPKGILFKHKTVEGEQTNPRKPNPANNRKWQSPCYIGKKWHICEIVETKMAKSVL